MDTLSFALGIASVVVTAVAVVAIYTFVMALRHKKLIDKFDQRLVDDNVIMYQYINNENSNFSRRVDDLEREIFSQLDSRLDKLENKLTNKK